MRRILSIAYYFPPVGGAGVQRTVKFVRYLPEYGYECLVVTGPGSTGSRWSPLDETLGYEVEGASVLRAAGPEPPPPGRLRSRFHRLTGNSPFAHWWIERVAALGLRAGEVDLVYASLGPYESAAAAARVATELGRPWVADLRDPWALDEMMIYPSALHRARELRRMRAALESASGIVMNTREATDKLLRAFPEFAAKVVATIPNGYDAEDFAREIPARSDDAFRVAHTGYLHTELGRRHRRTGAIRRVLGGAVPGVDILTRSHLYLLDAVDLLRRREPELGSRIELYLAGVLAASDLGEARNDVVLNGYLPHLQSIALLRSADLLFLPMQNLPPGRRATIVPGKTYEYLAAGTPILAAVPEGDARDLLVEAGGTRVYRPDDVAGLADGLEAELRLWRDAVPRQVPRREVVERYERRRQTAALAQVFDQLLSR